MKDKIMNIYEKIKIPKTKIPLVKKSILGLILLVIIATFVSSNISRFKAYSIDSEEYKLEKGTPIEIGDTEYEIYRDSKTVMVMDTTTTNVRITDLETGVEWNTLGDSLNGKPGIEKQRMSTVIVEYYDAKYPLNTHFMNSFEYSIEGQTYEIEQINNGVRVKYTLKDLSVDVNEIPEFITVEKYNELLELITDSTDKTYFTIMYKFDKNKNYYSFDTESNPEWVKGLHKALYEGAGFTQEDLNEQNKIFGVEGTVTQKEKPEFVVYVEFKMEDGDLVVNVPLNYVDYSGDYLIKNISLLPFFGSKGNSEDAFILVPDGSGAVVELDNASPVKNYQKYIYGADKFFDYLINKPGEESITMPVFGISDGNDGIFAIVEESPETAMLKTSLSTSSNPYNSINTVVQYNHSSYVYLFDEFDFDSKFKWNIKTDNFVSNYKVRYIFLDDKEENTYTGMAKKFKEYYQEKYDLELHDAKPETTIELLGSVNTTKFFAGIPYESLVEMTTFDQASTIIDELSDVKNLNVIYKGWFNNGINHDLPTKISPDNSIGGKKGFNDFNNQLSSDIDVFYDISFMETYKEANGYNHELNGMYLLNGKPATFQKYDINKNIMDREKYDIYYISPKYISSVIDKFINYNNKKEMVDSISLRNLGGSYYVDYKAGNNITPTEAKNIVIENLEKLSNEYKLLMYNPFDYAAPYADYISDLPLDSSNEHMFGYNIPFLQMVFNGFVDYSSRSFNVGNEHDFHYQFLKSLESASDIKFTLTYEDSVLLKYTDFNYYNSTLYTNHLDTIKSMSKEYNSVFSHFGNGIIDNHQVLEKNVVKVTYQNGNSIVINYNDYEVIVDGETINSLDYILDLEGGE